MACLFNGLLEGVYKCATRACQGNWNRFYTWHNHKISQRVDKGILLLLAQACSGILLLITQNPLQYPPQQLWEVVTVLVAYATCGAVL